MAAHGSLAQTRRDLNNIGGPMLARSGLLASAGRYVTISSSTHSTSFAVLYANQSRTELAGTLKAGVLLDSSQQVPTLHSTNMSSGASIGVG